MIIFQILEGLVGGSAGSSSSPSLVISLIKRFFFLYALIFLSLALALGGHILDYLKALMII
jgi:hypothetical protein